MQNVFKIYLVVLLLNFHPGSAQAQFVLIPDTNFVSYLNSSNFASCMNGNLMDTTCNMIVNENDLWLGNLNISNLDGIQYFDNLQELHCEQNLLSTLPTLPAQLKYLYCLFNQITILPPLPASLLTLDCRVNQLTLLPALPNLLIRLNCNDNPITSLPTLPNSLLFLECNNNDLTSLPSLPNSLKELKCGYNQINSLPLLPTTLEKLDCGVNQLISLPNIPVSLFDLRCNNNQLSTLPSLPNILNYLICSDNLLSHIPDLPSSVGQLFISNNPTLFCFPNYNTIGTLYWGNTGITCLPNAGIIGTAIPAINNLPLCLSISGCDFNWSIFGRIYQDTNLNCIRDTNELRFKNVPLQLDSGGNVLQSFIGNIEGYYSFQTGLGNYQIRIDTVGLPFDVICPASGLYFSSLTQADSLDEDLDFGLQCKTGYCDLISKSISPSSQLRPGSQRTLYLNSGDATLFYGVNCSAGVSGSVEVILDDLVSFISPASGALFPTQINGDTIIWNISDFSLINPSQDFNIIIQVDTNATINDTVCIILNTYPFTDNNPLNNNISNCFSIVNSIDPNAKEVYPFGTIDTSQRELIYTIYFQNTGNAVAENINVLDTLDTDLDINSFIFLSSSHSVITQLFANNIIRFNFPNINLPDSTTNEPASHGYVQFKVLLNSSLPIGTAIDNTANIIFDFNPPITTNTVTNEIQITTGNNSLHINEEITLYPNPVEQNLFISFNSITNEQGEIFLYDLFSRKLLQQQFVNTTTINLEHLVKGIYIYEIIDRKGGCKKGKIVKN